MDRRRAVPKRPASSEELECWTHASATLSSLSHLYAESSLADSVGKVNRLISQWPTDPDNLPADGFDTLRSMYKKLNAGIGEIKLGSETEMQAIDAALESLSVLIGLRRASESSNQERLLEKRKRPRVGSPASGAVTPSGPQRNGSISITVPPRNNSLQLTPQIPFSRDPKARREALAKQLPLTTGRRVAFHAPTKEEPNTWILAIIINNIQGDKNRYTVQDAEPQENGEPGRSYNATLRSIIPLPDPQAPPDSAIHPNAVYQFSPGETVMALYPDTSCFYRAEVIHGRREGPSNISMYTLKFEDDDDQEHQVPVHWVVEWPGDPTGGKK